MKREELLYQVFGDNLEEMIRGGYQVEEAGVEITTQDGKEIYIEGMPIRIPEDMTVAKLSDCLNTLLNTDRFPVVKIKEEEYSLPWVSFNDPKINFDQTLLIKSLGGYVLGSLSRIEIRKAGKDYFFGAIDNMGNVIEIDSVDVDGILILTDKVSE